MNGNTRISFKVYLFCIIGAVCFASTSCYGNGDDATPVQKNASIDFSDFESLKALIWEEYMYANPDSAYVLAQLGLEYAQSVGDTASMISALSLQGVSLNQRGRSEEAISHLQTAMELATLTKNDVARARLIGNIGNTYVNQGQYSKALFSFLECHRLFELTGERRAEAGALFSIGHIYHYNNRPAKALEYMGRALEVFRHENEVDGMATVLMSMGTSYKNLNQLDIALAYYDSALVKVKELDQPYFYAQWHHHMGALYLMDNNLEKALLHYSECKEASLEANHQRYYLGATLGIGKIYALNGRRDEAMNIAKKALEMAKEQGALEEQLSAMDILIQGYRELGNAKQALFIQDEMFLIQDSIALEETAQRLQEMEFNRQMLADSLRQEEEKLNIEIAYQQEVAKKEKAKNLMMAGGLLFLLAAIGFFFRWRFVKKSRDTISKEKDRSEHLLLNILPAEIAEELKEFGEAKARDFEMVSILFTDFKGFTQVSEQLSAADLVAEINTCFKAFDAIVGKHNIEKIKTIGDAYMCAGGLPVPDENAVTNTVLAGLEMQAFMKARKTERDAAGLPAFEMRVGIHTGPVVAGIVGVKKFQYDIWGDTVNTASRMETSGDVGKVNISEATYDLVKGNSAFSFISRGKIEAKGKGKMEMYFVSKAQ